MTSRPNVRHDVAAAAETHRRWLTRRNRKQEDEDGYLDEWYAQQCGICRLWVPLSGALGSDYGACTNAGSEFDGLARFEHDGCDAFELAHEWAAPED